MLRATEGPREMKRQPTLCLFGIGVLALTLLAWLPDAYGIPFFKPNLPDFYQHQKSGSDPAKPYGIPALAPDDPPNPLRPGYTNGNWWEDKGGWCCIAAFTNSFYFLDKRGFHGLFDHSEKSPSGLGGRPEDQGRSWQERMAYAIEDLAIDTFGLGLNGDPDGAGPRTRQAVTKNPQKTIPDFLQKYGFGDSLVYSEYFLDGGKVKRASICGFDVCSPGPGSVDTSFTSLFDVYYKELLRSEDVVFRIEYPPGTVDPSKSCTDQGLPWWCHSYHLLTGAGVERTKDDRTLWFADPNNTFHGADWGHPYTGTDPLPVPMDPVNDPVERARFYEEGMLRADLATFGTGPYANAAVTRIVNDKCKVFTRRNSVNWSDKDTVGAPRRRLQGGERRPRAPSPPARPKPGKTFIRVVDHLRNLEHGQSPFEPLTAIATAPQR